MKTATHYRDWPLYDDMPKGWVLDKTCGSPLAGYEFITNSKSILNGGKRALLRTRKPQISLSLTEVVEPKIESEAAAQPSANNDAPYPCKTVNELARARFKMQLLNDILCDLMICELEGWGKMEYINEIRKLINEIGSQVTIDA